MGQQLDREHPFSSFKKVLLMLFTCWLRLVFLAAWASLWLQRAVATLWLWCEGFLLQWLPLLPSTGSRHIGLNSCGSQALEHGLRS